MRISSLYVAALLLGCGDHDHPSTPEAPKSFEPLIGVADWSPIARELDPFVMDDASPVCESPGVRVEEAQSWLELDTNECGFITVIAGAGFGVEKGQELSVELSHFDLDAAESASAEVQLRFEACDVWDKKIAIPSAAQVYSERFASPCAIPQGGRVLFHVHNHGPNTYQLRNVTALR